jgi:hypothetical protein
MTTKFSSFEELSNWFTERGSRLLSDPNRYDTKAIVNFSWDQSGFLPIVSMF